jgi:hypothetical protein
VRKLSSSWAAKAFIAWRCQALSGVAEGHGVSPEEVFAATAKGAGS